MASFLLLYFACLYGLEPVRRTNQCKGASQQIDLSELNNIPEVSNTRYRYLECQIRSLNHSAI